MVVTRNVIKTSIVVTVIFIDNPTLTRVSTTHTIDNSRVRHFNLSEPSVGWTVSGTFGEWIDILHLLSSS